MNKSLFEDITENDFLKYGTILNIVPTCPMHITHNNLPVL